MPTDVSNNKVSFVSSPPNQNITVVLINPLVPAGHYTGQDSYYPSFPLASIVLSCWLPFVPTGQYSVYSTSQQMLRVMASLFKG